LPLEACGLKPLFQQLQREKLRESNDCAKPTSGGKTASLERVNIEPYATGLRSSCNSVQFNSQLMIVNRPICSSLDANRFRLNRSNYRPENLGDFTASSRRTGMRVSKLRYALRC
jgi:hypothetical protein